MDTIVYLFDQAQKIQARTSDRRFKSNDEIMQESGFTDMVCLIIEIRKLTIHRQINCNVKICGKSLMKEKILTLVNNLEIFVFHKVAGMQCGPAEASRSCHPAICSVYERGGFKVAGMQSGLAEAS